MGFGSFLKSAGKLIGKQIPGVGTAIDIMDMAGDVGSVLGKQQQGKSEGAIKQADVQQRQDQLALQRFQQMQQAQDQAARMDLDRKKFTGDEQQRNARLALMSQLLGGGIAPTRVSVPGIAPAQISGGILES